VICEAEQLFWEIVRNRQFHGLKFYRQFPLFYDIEGSESFFIADFFCHELQTVIELDGPIHKYQITEDERRTEILNFLGCRVIRFRNEEILAGKEQFIKKLEKHIWGEYQK
jgi:very-short-patch-repair endonuclease